MRPDLASTPNSSFPGCSSFAASRTGEVGGVHNRPQAAARPTVSGRPGAGRDLGCPRCPRRSPLRGSRGPGEDSPRRTLLPGHAAGGWRALLARQPPEITVYLSATATVYLGVDPEALEVLIHRVLVLSNLDVRR